MLSPPFQFVYECVVKRGVVASSPTPINPARSRRRGSGCPGVVGENREDDDDPDIMTPLASTDESCLVVVVPCVRAGVRGCKRLRLDDDGCTPGFEGRCRSLEFTDVDGGAGSGRG